MAPRRSRKTPTPKKAPGPKDPPPPPEDSAKGTVAPLAKAPAAKAGEAGNRTDKKGAPADPRGETPALEASSSGSTDGNPKGGAAEAGKKNDGEEGKGEDESAAAAAATKGGGAGRPGVASDEEASGTSDPTDPAYVDTEDAEAAHGSDEEGGAAKVRRSGRKTRRAAAAATPRAASKKKMATPVSASLYIPSAAQMTSGLRPERPRGSSWRMMPAPELVGTLPAPGSAASSWEPIVGPPHIGMMWFDRYSRCACGKDAPPNHIAQCIIALQQWAIAQAAWREYAGAVGRITRVTDGITQADIPPFRLPRVLHPLQYGHQAGWFPSKVNEPALREAVKTAKEVVAAEETRFWHGEPTHRALALYVSRSGGVWPEDAILRTPTSSVSRRYAAKVAPVPNPGWRPRDLYVAEAIKNMYYRTGQEFDLFSAPLKAGGRDRGMVVLRVGASGDPVAEVSDQLIMVALREDRDAAAKGTRDYRPWFPPPVLRQYESDLEGLIAQIKKDDALFDGMVKRPQGKDGEVDTPDEDKKMAAVPAVVNPLLEIESSEDEVEVVEGPPRKRPRR